MTVDDDDKYEGDRSTTLTLTADGYTPVRVTVNITEDDLQTIELMVVGTTALNLVRFLTTDITVRVNVATGLTVRAEGAVSLASGVAEYDLTEDALSQQIQIEAVSVGEGTITFTASGARQSTAMEMVRVMVSTPTLVISDVSALAINLVARTTTGLTVRVSAEAGVPEGVTLTATVSGEAGRVVSVNPMERVIETVSVDTPAMFTVEGLDAGDTTITLIASHPDYESTSIDVSVSVYLPGVGLIVSTPSPFEQGATGLLTVAVSASTQAMITIRSGNDDIARVSSQPFTLMGGEINNSTMIEVSGVGIGRTTLTITASADGYAIGTATVMVDVLNRFRIGAMPARFNLAEGSSRTISVSLNRIPEGSSSVTVTINLPEGSGLTVSTSLLTFRTTVARTITVTATNNNDYTGNRDVTLTFTATGYTTATVTIRIIDNEAPPVESPLIGLSVSSSRLNIASGMSDVLTVAVNAGTVTEITISSSVTGIVRVSPESFSLMGGGSNSSTEVVVSGMDVGMTLLTIAAAADGYEDETTVVSVEVLEALSLVVTPVSVVLAEGTSSLLSVGVNRIEAGSDSVTVTIELEGSGLSVSPSSLTFSATKLQATVTVTATNNNGYTGDREVTLTFEADDYASATVAVGITEGDPQPEIELAVAPTALNLVRFTTSTEIEVSVAVDAMLNIQTMGAVSLTNGRNLAELNLSGRTTRIAIVGVSEGMGTVTVTASGIGDGTGAEQETQTVSVTVSAPTLMISEVRPSNINLAARETTVVIVSVSAEAGVPEGVTLTATVTRIGTENVASVTPTEITVSANTQTMFTVEGLDAGNTTLILTASHQDYISTITEVAVSVYLPPVGLSASTALEITVGTTEALTIQVNAEDAIQATLTTSVEMSTVISVTAPATPESLTGGNTIINVTGDNQGETDLVIRVEADGYETTEITVRVRVIPVPVLRFRIKVFLEGAQQL